MVRVHRFGYVESKNESDWVKPVEHFEMEVRISVDPRRHEIKS